MSEEPKIIDGIAVGTTDKATAEDPPLTPTPDDKSIIITRELIPEALLLIPLYSRPLFSKMMAPLLFDNLSTTFHIYL